MDTMFLAFVLAFVICGAGILLGDHKFPFASLSIIGFGLIAGAGGIWLVSGVETWSASSVFGSIAPFVLSVLCLVSGYLRLTKKTIAIGSIDEATLQSKEQKIIQFVFEKEPLRDDEKVLACWDGSLTNRLTTGMLLTNQAIINWDTKKIERFNFREMENIATNESKLVLSLEFVYNNKNTSLAITTSDGFSRAVIKAISEVTEINRKYVEYFPSARAFHVPMIDNKLSVNFPNNCVYCGVPAETTKTIEVAVSDKGSSQRGQTITTTTLTRSIKIAVPYCRSHAELSEQNNNMLYRLFGFGLLLGLLTGFIIIFSQTTLGDFLSTTFSSFIGFMWSLAFTITPSIAGGFLLMWLPKLLPFLFKNKTLKHHPSLFSHHGGDLGINFNFSNERDALFINFVNPEITQEFAQLNNAKAKNWLGKEIKKE